MTKCLKSGMLRGRPWWSHDFLADILSWRDSYCECKCIIAGDFNTSLDRSDPITARIVKFIQDCSFKRCDDLFPLQKKCFSEAAKLYRL